MKNIIFLSLLYLSSSNLLGLSGVARYSSSLLRQAPPVVRAVLAGSLDRNYSSKTSQGCKSSEEQPKKITGQHTRDYKVKYVRWEPDAEEIKAISINHYFLEWKFNPEDVESCSFVEWLAKKPFEFATEEERRCGKNRHLRLLQEEHSDLFTAFIDKQKKVHLSEERSREFNRILDSLEVVDAENPTRNRRLEIKQKYDKLVGRVIQKRNQTMISSINDHYGDVLISQEQRPGQPDSSVVETIYCDHVFETDEVILKIRARKYMPCEIIPSHVGTEAILYHHDRETTNGKIKVEIKIRKKETSDNYGSDTVKYSLLSNTQDFLDLCKASDKKEKLKRITKMLDRSLDIFTSSEHDLRSSHIKIASHLEECIAVEQILQFLLVTCDYNISPRYSMEVVRTGSTLIIHNVDDLNKLWEKTAYKWEDRIITECLADTFGGITLGHPERIKCLAKVLKKRS